ncbi:MAG: GNAT family N-acetyltransferase [Lachnospiraceae bacterium]|nr:GNAT family N-acetyltransferase [Lachnospiraceae bacterium]
MENEEITLRLATLYDAPRLLEIYGSYVKNTAITFEYEVPSLEEFRGRMTAISAKYPYLCAAQGDRILGYAYAGPFHVRAAYHWASELTIYLDKDARKAGLGRLLYGRMEEILKKMGILNLYACIGYPEKDDEYLTANSAQFHEHLGFHLVGTFQNCGYKFQRWYHMVFMEKIIGEHVTPQPEVIWFPDLR